MENYLLWTLAEGGEKKGQFKKQHFPKYPQNEPRKS